MLPTHGQCYRNQMGGNPKDSEWRSTPNERRTRKRFETTMSERALDKLLELAKQVDPVSPARARGTVVERLILACTRVPKDREGK